MINPPSLSIITQATAPCQRQSNDSGEDISPVAQRQAAPFIVFGKYNFSAEEEDEVYFQFGEPLIVLEKDEAFNDGWWKGQNIRGQIGLFPMNFITTENLVSYDISSLSSVLASWKQIIQNHQNSASSDAHVHNNAYFSPSSASTERDDAPSPSLLISESTVSPVPSIQETFHISTPLDMTYVFRHPSSWSVEEVAVWIEMKGFKSLAPRFYEGHVTGTMLLELTLVSLKELGVDALADRINVLHRIFSLKEKWLADSGLVSPSFQQEYLFPKTPTAASPIIECAKPVSALATSANEESASAISEPQQSNSWPGSPNRNSSHQWSPVSNEDIRTSETYSIASSATVLDERALLAVSPSVPHFGYGYYQPQSTRFSTTSTIYRPRSADTLNESTEHIADEHRASHNGTSWINTEDRDILAGHRVSLFTVSDYVTNQVQDAQLPVVGQEPDSVHASPAMESLMRDSLEDDDNDNESFLYPIPSVATTKQDMLEPIPEYPLARRETESSNEFDMTKKDSTERSGMSGPFSTRDILKKKKRSLAPFSKLSKRISSMRLSTSFPSPISPFFKEKEEDIPLSDLDLSGPDYEGCLTIRIGDHRALKTRYAVLKNATLYLFRDETKQRLVKVLGLTHDTQVLPCSNVSEREKAKMPFSFVLSKAQSRSGVPTSAASPVSAVPLSPFPQNQNHSMPLLTVTPQSPQANGSWSTPQLSISSPTVSPLSPPLLLPMTRLPSASTSTSSLGSNSSGSNVATTLPDVRIFCSSQLVMVGWINALVRASQSHETKTIVPLIPIKNKNRESRNMSLHSAIALIAACDQVKNKVMEESQIKKQSSRASRQRSASGSTSNASDSMTYRNDDVSTIYIADLNDDFYGESSSQWGIDSQRQRKGSMSMTYMPKAKFLPASGK